jgi:hypothetical protein
VRICKVSFTGGQKEFKASGNHNASDTGGDYCEHSLNVSYLVKASLMISSEKPIPFTKIS